MSGQCCGGRLFGGFVFAPRSSRIPYSDQAAGSQQSAASPGDEALGGRQGLILGERGLWVVGCGLWVVAYTTPYGLFYGLWLLPACKIGFIRLNEAQY